MSAEHPTVKCLVPYLAQGTSPQKPVPIDAVFKDGPKLVAMFPVSEMDVRLAQGSVSQLSVGDWVTIEITDPMSVPLEGGKRKTRHLARILAFDSSQESSPKKSVTIAIDGVPTDSAIETVPLDRFERLQVQSIASSQIDSNTRARLTFPEAKIRAKREERISRMQRSTPPLGMVDTVIFKPGEGVRSIHDTAIQFLGDSEILRRIPESGTKSVRATNGSQQTRVIDVSVTADGKAMIQQQGTRGCTAAAASMLIVDRGGTIDLKYLRTTNLGDPDTQMSAIREAGLQPLISHIPPDLRELEKLIKKNGPAIIGVNGELGNHVVVVDSVDLKKGVARIRDPWHGWQLDVTTRAIQSRFIAATEPVIQIAEPPK